MTDPQPTVQTLSVQQLLNARGQEWSLELIAGGGGLQRRITTAELNRPGLALAGYYEVFTADRIQLIGLTESSFLRSLSPEQREQAIERTLGFNIPCLIVTTDQPICEELIAAAHEREIPLFKTPLVTSPFQYDLGHFLERRLAPCYTIHGVMMDVFGMGVLIQGKSGVGKSEVGLELIERGHRLIADDVVMLRRVSKDELIGETAPNIGYHMELRGIGIIDVELLFGVRAVREAAQVGIVVTMERWDADKEYERLGLSDRERNLFECMIPEYVLPVEPGRNIAKLIEVAALTHRLEEQGIHVAREFDKRIMESLSKGSEGRMRAFDLVKTAHERRRAE